MDINKVRVEEQFGSELMMIRDEGLRRFVSYALQRVPEYFWTMPSSTTGKYHPEYTLGNGGLVRHTKAAVKIANDLLGLDQYSHLNRDKIISALILHDTVKKGNDGSKWTATEHPIYAAKLIGACYSEGDFAVGSVTIMDINRLIKSHMGQWNKDYNGNEVLPIPTDEDEKFVHLCDYLASRKYLTVEGL